MTPTEIRQQLHQQIDQMPFDLLVLVEDFLEFLRFKHAKASDSAQSVSAVDAEVLQLQTLPKRPRRNIRGLCADLDLSVNEEDIATARQEMWGNFPREDIA
ncbi:MAG: hypothetical protein AAFX01_14215 [Cyanobacteria bacterium J06638_28]